MGRGSSTDTVNLDMRFDAATGAVFVGEVSDEERRLTENLRVVLARSRDLLKPKYRGSSNPMTGHCYVATETLYHLLGGKEEGWSGYYLTYDQPGSWKPGKESHWWLENADGRRIDATADQFSSPVPYERGRKAAFVTNARLGSDPSERSAKAIGRLSQLASSARRGRSAVRAF